MSMMAVPSIGHDNIPRGNAYGWHRRNPTVEQSGLSGVGYYDANGDWQPDESPYPVVFDSGPGTVSYPAGSSPPVDWATFISNAIRGIDNTIAVSQGGSVTSTGTYGSAGTASIAASGYPAAGIGAGIGGLFNSPVLLLGIVGIVVIMASKSK